MLSVNMQHLCIPPFVPIACIEIGHYMLHGQWLKTASFKTLFEEIGEYYDKVFYGEGIASDIGLDTIRKRAKRFNTWIEKIISLGQ